jgi:large subunit ribosomal protein L18
MSIKQDKRIRRHKKIRMNIHGTKDRPRLYVWRSNQHIYAQLINDESGKVLAQISDIALKVKKADKKTDVAKEIGKAIAKKAVENKIESVVFDRGGLVFHGRIKAVAEGAREAGLKF